jgi:predicted glycoside hydrolase/deacetylase ChbG (UPF0249 family)
MRKLILNADDYGLTQGVSRGIRFAFSAGCLSSTTAMTNIPGADRGLENAKRDTPSLPIGVHLTLTAGRPVLPPEKIPTLVDGEGRFYTRKTFLARLGEIEPSEAGREFRAQIGALQSLGIRPDHLDSHHFASYLTPGLLEQMLLLAKEFGLAVRPPTGCDGAMADLFPGLPDSTAAFLQHNALNLIRQTSVPTADRLYLTFYNNTATRKHLQWIIGNLPEGTSEIMCHPGTPDRELRAASDYAEERGFELTLLTECSLPDWLEQEGIRLASYSGLHA